jgi:hypothetical protein
VLVAATAAARPWRVQTIGAAGTSFSHAVDVLPNGRTAVLLQRGEGNSNRLELRVGGRVRVLDRGAGGGFGNADIQHDARGRLVVTWGRVLQAPRAFVWTEAAGRTEISGSSAAVSLAVAANGRAAIAYSSPGGAFVVRRSSGGRFGSAEPVAAAGSQPGRPGIDVTSRGRVVVAWSVDRRVLARSANGPAAFGPAEIVQLRAPAAGTTLVAGDPEVALTSDDRAVVAVSSNEVRTDTVDVVDRRIEAFEWKRTAQHPSAAATLSRGAKAGAADLVASGQAAVIAWTQRPKGAPRSLWAARWTRKGLQRPNVYDTRALGSPVLLTAAPRGGIDAFYRAGGRRWFTVRLAATGLYRGTSTVTPPGAEVEQIDVAAAGGNTAAAWTIGRRSRSLVQVARPGR